MGVISITKVDFIEDKKLFLKFNTGEEGIVDLENELDLPIFENLKNPDYFKSFKLTSWTIEWPNGADFAPEFLYKLMKKSKLAIEESAL